MTNSNDPWRPFGNPGGEQGFGQQPPQEPTGLPAWGWILISVSGVVIAGLIVWAVVAGLQGDNGPPSPSTTATSTSSAPVQTEDSRPDATNSILLALGVA